MGTITTAIVLYLLRLFTQTQHISTATHTCDNDGLVKKVSYLMQQTHTSVLSDPVDADLVLPIAHWGSKMGSKMRWIQGHVERRKPNQEEWIDEEWINVAADELAERAWTPTPSPSLTPTMNPTNNNIAIKFTQCSSLQVLHKEKSISGNVARQLPRRITINKGKEGTITAIKYTSAQMSKIDYQAMNSGSRKFRSSPYARVHWAKHQGNQWYTEEKANKFEDSISATCRCCDKGKKESIRHVIQCKSRTTIHEKKLKQFTELMQQVEMPNDILKLMEGGIDLVLSGGETHRGEIGMTRITQHRKTSKLQC